jgi:hypothetical protein
VDRFHPSPCVELLTSKDRRSEQEKEFYLEAPSAHEIGGAIMSHSVVVANELHRTQLVRNWTLQMRKHEVSHGTSNLFYHNSGLWDTNSPDDPLPNQLSTKLRFLHLHYKVLQLKYPI